MPRKVRAIFYLPVGEGDRIDYLIDSIEAIHHHSGPDVVVMLMDDSGDKDHGQTLQKTFPNLIVHKTDPKFQGKGLAGRHGFETARILKYAVDNYWFDVIFRLDTDALITGDHIEEDLIQLFKEKPNCGLLGRHWVNAEGYLIDRGKSRELIDRLNRLPYRLYFLRAMTGLNRLIARAKCNGYIEGELVLGCATAYTYECAFRIAAFIDDFKSIRTLRGLAEDYFTTIFVKYVNLEYGDASHPEGPMAVQLKGIPLTLDELLANNKKVIHSIKNDQRYSQDEIRAFFRANRERQAKSRNGTEVTFLEIQTQSSQNGPSQNSLK
jgi:hypothetical protein